MQHRLEIHDKNARLSKYGAQILEYAEDESLTGLAVESSRKALEMAKVNPVDVDLILLCTSTPDDLFGSAPEVHITPVLIHLEKEKTQSSM